MNGLGTTAEMYPAEPEKNESFAGYSMVFVFHLIFLYTILLWYIPNTYGISLCDWVLYMSVLVGLLMLLFVGLFSVERGGMGVLPVFSQIVFMCLMMMSCITFARGAPFTTSYFISHDGAGVWLIPIAMIVGTRPFVWVHLRKVFMLHTLVGVSMGVVGLVMGTRNPLFLKLINSDALYASGFLSLACSRQNLFGIRLGVIGMLMMAAGGALCGSRTIVFTASFLLIVTFFRRPWIMIDSYMIMAMGIIVAIALYLEFQPDVRSTSSFAYKQELLFLKAKTFTDSRLMHVREFFSDVKGVDLLIGRGGVGSYKSRIFQDDRGGIEIGYLQLILKGGLIMLVLFVALTLFGVTRGMTHFRQPFCGACVVMIVTRLLVMIPFGLPFVHPDYLLFWLCVGACLNHELRLFNPYGLKRSKHEASK
ncbi:hypothetical protein ACFLS1_03530 [Verrucomicrobiota bacterium]